MNDVLKLSIIYNLISINPDTIRFYLSMNLRSVSHSKNEDTKTRLFVDLFDFYLGEGWHCNGTDQEK